METIGELARRTGTSRRMLRHWEALGLLAPAEVNPWTQQRRYAPAQAGHVRAIVTLRAIGFGLDAIRDLLAQDLTEPRLLALLRRREAELADRIAQDSAALAQVRTRLRLLQKDRDTIMHTLTIGVLPETHLVGFTETVTDETEIPDAVGRLLTRLGVATPLTHDVELMYDGTTDDSVIVVSAGVPGPPAPTASDAEAFVLPAAERAAVARFETRPGSAADAWVALDAELAGRGFRAVGPYRQTLHADGSVTLATPVASAAECP